MTFLQALTHRSRRSVQVVNDMYYPLAGWVPGSQTLWRGLMSLRLSVIGATSLMQESVNELLV